MRPAAVAGLFYPDDPEQLRRAVRGHLEAGAVAVAAAGRPAAGPVAAGPAPTWDVDPGGDVGPAGSEDGPGAGPDALIAPHAGYRYSGPTAGAGWAALASRPAPVSRVVLAGPAHRVPVGPPGVGVSSAGAWRTPLGDVPVDREAAEDLVATGRAVVADEAHAPEHSLEVHLPFLAEVLPDVPVVPLLVGGRCPPRVAAEAIGQAWERDGTVVVVSSDLSHYLTEAEARRRDDRTLAAIVEGRAGDLQPEDACGRAAIAGLVVAARRRSLAPSVLAVATSADASGDTGRVVGYASLAYRPPRPLEDEERSWLVERARVAVAHAVAARRPEPSVDVPPRLRLPGASFVTLRRHGELSGCIGSLEPARPLWHDVARNARSAATADPRFPPLRPRDLDGLAVKVSVLSAVEPLPAGREALLAILRPGVDGVLVEAGGRRGTFLPAVWEALPEADAFLAALLAKAGLPPAGWPADLRAWRYTTDEFGT